MSKQVKEKSKEEQPKGIAQGTYDTVVIVPKTTKREHTFEDIVSALKSGKYFVMREGYTRNSIYTLLRNIKERTKIEACFGVIETKGVKQFALFVQKKTPEA